MPRSTSILGSRFEVTVASGIAARLHSADRWGARVPPLSDPGLEAARRLRRFPWVSRPQGRRGNRRLSRQVGLSLVGLLQLARFCTDLHSGAESCRRRVLSVESACSSSAPSPAPWPGLLAHGN